MKHARSRVAARVGLAITSLAISACGLNQSGNLAAKDTGDTSHPAERGSPNQALVDACGAGQPTTAGAVIRRRPYLQQVTTTSAMIGWVSTNGDGERVEVTTPDGQPVASTPATVEATAVRTAGEHQMWAQLAELQPNTTYCYAVTDGTQPLVERTGFRTAPQADTQDTVRFMAFGDSGGGGNDQYALAEQMSVYPYDLMIHTGDVAYDNGTIGQFEDNVFGVYADLFKNLMFAPAAGNHDYETMKGAPFRDVFALPGSSGERWYSYDWGPIHFVALDTEADYAAQIAWLDEDLAATQRPWKVVYMHRPPYSSGDHGSDVRLRDLLAPVAERHKVQLVLAGHDHDYERMKPQSGIAYVVTGGGGRGTRPVTTSSFTAFSAEVIHYVMVEVQPDQMVLHAIDGTGAEFDSMVIPRE